MRSVFELSAELCDEKVATGCDFCGADLGLRSGRSHLPFLWLWIWISLLWLSPASGLRLWLSLSPRLWISPARGLWSCISPTGGLPRRLPSLIRFRINVLDQPPALGCPVLA